MEKEEDDEVLSVSSEKLLSILDAINDRLTNLKDFIEQSDEMSGVLDSLVRNVDNLEQILFDNNETLEELAEKIENLRNEVGDREGVDDITGETGPGSGIPDNFRCPRCSGPIERSDAFCRWCGLEGHKDLRPDRDRAMFRDGYYRESYPSEDRGGPESMPVGERYFSTQVEGTRPEIFENGGREYGTSTRDNDGIDRSELPSGPPPDWSSRDVGIDGSGKPVCPFCHQSMEYISEYERWFCEPCWYYAPSDFMIAETKGADKEEKTIKKKIFNTGKDRRDSSRGKRRKKRKKRKKIGDLSLFKTK